MHLGKKYVEAEFLPLRDKTDRNLSAAGTACSILGNLMH